MSDSGSEDAFVRPVSPDETISQAVIRAVEEVTGRNATPTDDAVGALDELYRTIDPDALDALFRRETFDGAVEFYWEGRRIEIDGGTHVVVSRT